MNRDDARVRGHAWEARRLTAIVQATLWVPAFWLVPDTAFAKQSPSTASADEAHAEKAHVDRKEATVIVSGVEADTSALILDLRAVLEQSGFSPEVNKTRRIELEAVLAAPQPPYADARVLIDTTGQEAVLVIIADDARGRVSIRRIERGNDDADVVAEKILQIVQSSLGAIAAGSEFGQDREQALAELRAQKQPEPTEEPSERTGPEPEGAIDASATLAYGLQLPQQGSWAHGPRLGSVLTLSRGAARPSVFATVGYLFGPRLDTDGVTGRLDWIPIRLGGGAALSTGPFIFSLRAGGGVDVVLRNLEFADDLIVSSGADIDPAIVVMLRSEWEVSSDVGVFVDVSGDIYPRTIRYLVLDETGDEREIFAPQRFRPSLHVGARFF